MIFAQTTQFEYFYDKTANTVTFKTAWNQQDAWTAYYSTLVKVDDVKNGVYKNGTQRSKTKFRIKLENIRREVRRRQLRKRT